MSESFPLVTRGFAPLRGDEWGGCAVGWWVCPVGGSRIGGGTREGLTRCSNGRENEAFR